MLLSLSIRNVVLIDKLDLDFKSGLSVLTGETGAGKSILLDSLGLLLGNRAETGLIRQGEDKLSVTGIFTAPDDIQFKELLPILWMKSGAIGTCPELTSDELPKMLICQENKFAVLIDENSFSDFEIALRDKPEIQTVYLITDYEVNYRAMKKNLSVKTTYQLYRDYLDNFRINHGRN